MIVDADVKWIPGAYEIDAMLRDMELSHVERALVSVETGACTEGLEKRLERLCEATRTHPQLIGAACVDPRLDACAALISRCRREFGFPAVWVDSAQCGVALDDFALMDAVAKAALGLDMPLFVCVSAATFDLTHPMRLESLLQRWPQLKTVAVHMGGAARPDYCEDVFGVAERNPNLWLLGSANYWQRIVQAFQTVGAERLLFGSASPRHGLMPACVEAYGTLLSMAEADEAQASKVLGGNLRALLRLEKPDL